MAKAKQPFWVSRVPVLSTAHVSQATMDRLQGGPVENAFGTVAAYPDGVFLSLTTIRTPDDLPPDLGDLCRWVRRRRYGWIRLDADGDVVAGLPVYDWSLCVSKMLIREMNSSASPFMTRQRSASRCHVGRSAD